MYKSFVIVYKRKLQTVGKKIPVFFNSFFFSGARISLCVCVYDAYKYIQYTHTYIILYTEGCNKALKKKNGGGSERASVCARTRKMKLRGKGIQHSGDNV